MIQQITPKPTQKTNDRLKGVRPARFSKLSHEFFQRDLGVAQNALQGLGHELPVIGHGDVNIALAEANMRTLLAHHFKAKPSQCFHGFRVGDIPGQFQAGVKTGSATK